MGCGWQLWEKAVVSGGTCHCWKGPTEWCTSVEACADSAPKQATQIYNHPGFEQWQDAQYEECFIFWIGLPQKTFMISVMPVDSMHVYVVGCSRPSMSMILAAIGSHLNVQGMLYCQRPGGCLWWLGPCKVALLCGVHLLEKVCHCVGDLWGRLHGVGDLLQHPVFKLCPVRKRASSWLPAELSLTLPAKI